MRHTFIAGFLIAIVALSACGTLQAAPSLLDQGQSPRRSTLAGMELVSQGLERLTVGAPLLPVSFLDDVDHYADRAETAAARYLDATEACVVIDGALQTDTSTAAACDKSLVGRAFGDVSSLLAEAAARAGPTDTGRGLLFLSIVLDRNLAPSSGDFISGYEKREDVTRDAFRQARASLKAAFDKFRKAAADARAVLAPR